MALIPDLSDLFSATRELTHTSKVDIIEATAAEWVREVKDTPYHLGILGLKIVVAVKRILKGACAHHDNAPCALIYIRAAGRMLGDIDAPFKATFDMCIVENMVLRMQIILDPRNIRKWPAESPLLEAHWTLIKHLYCGRYLHGTLFDVIYLAYMKRFLSSLPNPDSESHSDIC